MKNQKWMCGTVAQYEDTQLNMKIDIITKLDTICISICSNQNNCIVRIFEKMPNCNAGDSLVFIKKLVIVVEHVYISGVTVQIGLFVLIVPCKLNHIICTNLPKNHFSPLIYWIRQMDGHHSKYNSPPKTIAAKAKAKAKQIPIVSKRDYT